MGVLHRMPRADWVSAARFSHGGTKLAVADRSGLLSVYLFVMIRLGEAPALSQLHERHIGEAILEVRWSRADEWLFVGGEDYCITVIDTAKYSVQRQIGRERWVTSLAPSRDGAFLAGGGGSSHLSLFDVVGDWKEATCVPVRGGMALATAWHPRDDEYLAVAGQCDGVTVYESSCRRLPQDGCLRAEASILAVEFSPDGQVLAVGSESGLVTFFNVTKPNKRFETIYETVVGVGGEMAVEWSRDGKHVAIYSGSTFVLLSASCSGKTGMHPDNAARFLVRKVLQNAVHFTSLSLSADSRFVALAQEDRTRILDLTDRCKCVRDLDDSASIDQSHVVSSAWNGDGSVFAIAASEACMVSIYNAELSPRNWELLFSISFKETITSLCWGPSAHRELQYLAFGGEGNSVVILEIRITRAQEKQGTEHTQRNDSVPNPPEQTLWEAVLQTPCDFGINDLVWNSKGMLCIGDDDGNVSVLDLSYLKTGKPVSEMNYNWQRQGIISQMKLTRNAGRNAITSLCWAPPRVGAIHRDLLVVGGTDGIFEIIDLSSNNDMNLDQSETVSINQGPT